MVEAKFPVRPSHCKRDKDRKWRWLGPWKEEGKKGMGLQIVLGKIEARLTKHFLSRVRAGTIHQCVSPGKSMRNFHFGSPLDMTLCWRDFLAFKRYGEQVHVKRPFFDPEVLYKLTAVLLLSTLSWLQSDFRHILSWKWSSVPLEDHDLVAGDYGSVERAGSTNRRN